MYFILNKIWFEQLWCKSQPDKVKYQVLEPSTHGRLSAHLQGNIMLAPITNEAHFLWCKHLSQWQIGHGALKKKEGQCESLDYMSSSNRMLIRPSDECLIKNNNDKKHLKWLLYARCTHFIIPINYNISEDWTVIILVLQIKKGKLRASFHSLFWQSQDRCLSPQCS